MAITLAGTLHVDVSTPGTIAVEDPPDSDLDGIEPWALLRGLIDNFKVHRDGKRTTVSMSWPIA